MANAQRSTAGDGTRNNFENWVLSHGKGFWRLLQSNEGIHKWLNKIIVNSAVAKMKPRPHQFSLFGDYVSWDSLTNRQFSSRHIAGAPPGYTEKLPPLEDVIKLFKRGPEMRMSKKSTVMFAQFAQWFTDGFLRTDRQDWRKNTSNHDIDVSPLYGLNAKYTDMLRSHVGGKFKSQLLGKDGIPTTDPNQGEEYALFYFDESGKVRDEFKDLPIVLPDDVPKERYPWLFAMGGDRSNVQIGYVMLNTLFLREHNRIATEMARANPTWDDERLFQTARNVITVLLIKIVVEEYINHISPYMFKFLADPAPFAQVAHWYRTNWMSVEFALLYRWHGLVPSTIDFGSKSWDTWDTLFNNELLINGQLGPWFEASSSQTAGEIGLHNTPDFLIEAEMASLRLSRAANLQSYNEYRKVSSYPPVTSFDQISGDPKIQQELKDLYGHVDNVEFYVGLFAEDPIEHSLVGPMVGRMVGVDAFSQALTNPLLSYQVFNESTFSPVGWKIIQDTKTLGDVVNRNCKSTGQPFKVTMTLPGQEVG